LHHPFGIDKSGHPILHQPHPAAKKVCVLCIDDYVEFTENGVTKKARVAGFKNDNRLDIRPIYASGTMKDWIIATSELMLEKGWKPQSTKNLVAVNKLFGECSARKITVSPIGRVR